MSPYIQDQEARDLESRGKRERRAGLFLPACEITHICGSKDRRQGQRIEQPCEQPPSTRYTRAKRSGAGITGFRDVRLSKRLNYQDLRSSFRLSLSLFLCLSFSILRAPQGRIRGVLYRDGRSSTGSSPTCFEIE